MTKVKGIRAAETGELYFQFTDRPETFATDANSSHAALGILAFSRDAEITLETSPATGPGNYHRITGIYIGRWG
ncbi:MAG: hypothetical protein J0J06_07465 [Sphingomonas sp.]|uniref:hypothetical protein n=1 Tax=Sphingomonas sp. TaxID=28214 RepID=UPI001AD18DF0|nr:hypothetical protein [Sphingomonas sp.]MBN8815268.1 hypothetical protein [Sphingomonas sp.]